MKFLRLDELEQSTGVATDGGLYEGASEAQHYTRAVHLGRVVDSSWLTLKQLNGDETSFKIVGVAEERNDCIIAREDEAKGGRLFIGEKIPGDDRARYREIEGVVPEKFASF